MWRNKLYNNIGKQFQKYRIVLLGLGNILVKVFFWGLLDMCLGILFQSMSYHILSIILYIYMQCHICIFEYR